eukprot:COSAG02_NODE_3851_length_6147_cov_3.345899_8_plen_72_part_00
MHSRLFVNVCPAHYVNGVFVQSGSIAQAFGGEHHWTRGPTAAEFRAMSYLGLVNLQSTSLLHIFAAFLRQF